MERKFAWAGYSENDINKVNEFAERYKAFLGKGKTEQHGEGEKKGFVHSDLYWPSAWSRE